MCTVSTSMNVFFKCYFLSNTLCPMDDSKKETVKITTLCMYSNVIALMQYFNTALCATSVMRPGSWLSYHSGYHQHARLGT